MRIASLFSMNLSRLFHCSVIKVLCYCSSNSLFILSQAFVVVNNSFHFISSCLFCCFSTAHLGYHICHILSTTFLFFLTKVLYFKLPQSLPFSLPFLLSVPPHQRQLAYNSTRFSISQQLFPHFDKERQFHKFTELSSFSRILLSLLFEREFEIKFYSSANIVNTIGSTMDF